MANTEDKYLPITKVMEILSCSERFIYDLIVNSELIAIRIGTQARRISKNSLDDFIERRKIDPEDLLDADKGKKESAPDIKTETQKVAKSQWMRK